MVRLRTLEIKDADFMLEWLQDPEIQKYFHYPMKNQTKEKVLAFIGKSQECNPEINMGTIHYAVVDNSDEYLGTISLKNIDNISLNAEYAISMRKKTFGTGAAREATLLLLSIAFEKMKLKKVYLNVLEENRRAVKFYEKMGFIKEGRARYQIFLRGEFKTLCWYGMLREEFFLNDCRQSRGGYFRKLTRYNSNRFAGLNLCEVA